MKCGNCGHKNEGEAKFCERCGERLTIQCLTCGAANPPIAKFCEQCAAAFSGATQASMPPSAMITSPMASPPTLKATPALDEMPNPSLESAARPHKAGLSKWQVSVSLIFGLGMIGFLAMRDQASQDLSLLYPLTQPVSPPDTAAKPTPASKPSDPSNLAIEVLATYPIADITEHVGSILSAVNVSSELGISEGMDALNRLVLPSRGNRKIARKANERGLLAMRAESYDEATLLFISAVKADPADQEIINNLAFALEKGHRFTEARTAALSSLALAPMRANAWANLATILATEGEQDRAVSCFRLAYKFSQNQEKTIEYLKKLMEENSDVRVRDVASKAFILIQNP